MQTISDIVKAVIEDLRSNRGTLKPRTERYKYDDVCMTRTQYIACRLFDIETSDEKGVYL